jgi:hypothetical protein
MRPSIIRYTYYNIDKLLKPSCANCKYFSKEPSSFYNKENNIMSTCTKFLVKSQNNYTLKDAKIKGDYTEKHPYSLLARFDITMCGLNGKYFTPVNK